MHHINFKNCSSILVGVALCLSGIFLSSVHVANAMPGGVGNNQPSTFGAGNNGCGADGRLTGNCANGGIGTNGTFSSSNGNCNSATELCNPLKFNSFAEFFTGLLHIMVIFAIPIIILMIIYSGFLYVMAQGNEEQVTKATRSLTYAVLGGLIILGAELILQVIQGTVSQLTP